MKYTGILFWISLFAVSVSIGCGKEENQREIDEALIREYIAEKGLVTQTTHSGLHYVIDVPGVDEHPDYFDVVRIAYTGTTLDGNVFDASPDASFVLGNLIEGFREGIPLFGKGGSGLLIIPSHLGYGSQSYPDIPANSVLVFDITLTDF